MRSAVIVATVHNRALAENQRKLAQLIASGRVRAQIGLDRYA